ncbi:MAG: hypothetical protein ACI9YH_004020 [Colwellia sp.]|jgi:hypothetical protein
MSQDTLNRLEQAFTRLLTGTPERTAPDGKINISRINNEAGLSVSGINYYKDFIKEAKTKISRHKKQIQNEQEDDTFEEELPEIDKVKGKLSEALRLKKKYYQDLNDQKTINNGVIAQNISLAFKVNELEQEMMETSSGKVTRIQR